MLRNNFKTEVISIDAFAYFFEYISILLIMFVKSIYADWYQFVSIRFKGNKFILFFYTNSRFFFYFLFNIG